MQLQPMAKAAVLFGVYTFFAGLAFPQAAGPEPVEIYDVDISIGGSYYTGESLSILASSILLSRS